MKKHTVTKWIILIAMFMITAGICSASELDSFTGEKGVLRISGGTAHIPVMKEASRKIMIFNPGIQITIAGGGSGVGIKQVGEGLVNIGNSGRQATESEVSRYGLVIYKWAIDGVAAVVNTGNPVKQLSGKQLQDIFAGTILNWKALGGEDRGINVYTRDESSGTRAVFWKKALNKGIISGKANFIVSNGAMKSAISNDPYGIGYVSVGYIDKTVHPVRVDNVTPDLDTVKNGEYKVVRGLYSNTRGDASGLTKKFIDYLLSPAGQEIAVQKGFIPVN